MLSTLASGVHSLVDCNPTSDSFRADIQEGLNREDKQIPSKYLYDEHGSVLFDKICELDAYYPTRTEKQIMRTYEAEIAAAVGLHAAILEYGSGSSEKTHLLLQALESPAAYVPIDISKEHLMAAAERIANSFPNLPVMPVCADYTARVPMPVQKDAYRRALAYYPGSTIGNFLPAQATSFLAQMRAQVGGGGGILIGVDLKKDPDRLRRAYNDPEGVTAAFNKNLLRRINRELGADFNLGTFKHEARWVSEESRIEMHLVSTRAQTVRIAGEAVSFEEGESICTEYSHKYTIEGFTALARQAGLGIEATWTDADSLFSIHYAIPTNGVVADS